MKEAGEMSIVLYTGDGYIYTVQEIVDSEKEEEGETWRNRGFINLAYQRGVLEAIPHYLYAPHVTASCPTLCCFGIGVVCIVDGCISVLLL